MGPKTRERLQSALGTEGAVRAIESADVRALTEAGLTRGRATAILRRAEGGAGMAVLATRDARSVYKSVLELAADCAVTRHAADRVRVLTPLREREAIEDRLDAVSEAIDTWDGLDDDEREAVLAAFEDDGDAPTASKNWPKNGVSRCSRDRLTCRTSFPLSDRQFFPAAAKSNSKRQQRL